MNRYVVTVFSGGVAREILVTAHDIFSAVANAYANTNEVIKIELVGSSEREDKTF